jgi:spermidine synthase
VSDARLTAVAALTGAAVMMLELMGVRLAAPWFGQSQLVWTNVIGVVLAALAAGQWLGGRWAEGRSGPGPSALLVAAGAFALAQPDLVSWLAPRVLPDELSLLEAHPFVTWGSLLVSLLVLGVPMLALGGVTPWLVRLSLEAQSAPGRVAGRLLGAGTLGSLLGTFGASHLLLPWVGSAGTVRLAGVLLLGAAFLAGRPRAALAAWLLLPLATWTLPAPPALDGLLETRETAYQWARVVEHDDGARVLLLNEGLDSYHSLRPAEGVLTGGYYDAFLMPALVAPPSEDGEVDVLVVGLAAGTMAWQLERVAPSIRVTGVEIDEEVVELGRSWFALPEDTRVHAGVDGRVAVASSPRRFGAILVDAYANQIYLPPHLTTVEFFSLLRERLIPGGCVALNVGGLSLEDPVVAAVAATLSQAFDVVQAGRVPGTRNVFLLGWPDGAPASEDVATRLRAAGLWEALAWTTDAERLAVLSGAEGLVLRDGDAPLEDLAHASWRREWTAQPSVGTALGEPLAEARRLVRATRWSAAEAQLIPVLEDGSPSKRAEAGLLLGNIAYERGELGDARERWSTARSSADAGGGVAAALDQNLASIEEALGRRQELASAASKVRVSALGFMALAAVAIALVRRRSS